MTPDFHGLPTRSISNGALRLEFLAEAGPRLVRLFLPGSEENLLAELPDVAWDAPHGRFFPRGGHRLWHAPEAMPRTYVPDDAGLAVEELADGVRLCQPTETETGIRKSLEIHLPAGQLAVTLHHHLQNDGLWAVELAPWAITQLPLGGMAALPQPIAPWDSRGLLPNRHLVLWPYTRLDDPRLHLHDEILLIEGLVRPSPLKVGYLNDRGWIAHLRQGVLFCKRFEPKLGLPHPDLGCNVEVYCNDRFLELETLAPLCRLEPGQCTTHIEHWMLYTGLGTPATVDEVRALIQSLQL